MKPLTLDEIESIKEAAEVSRAKIREERDQYFEVVKQMEPLLAALASALYGEEVTHIPLDQLIKDAINFINGNKDGVIH